MSCVYVGRANFILAIRHNQPLRRVLLPLDSADVPLSYEPRPPGERSMILGDCGAGDDPVTAAQGPAGCPFIEMRHPTSAPTQHPEKHQRPGFSCEGPSISEDVAG